MANNPQKSDDPTQEALSAIQEALSIRQSDPRTATSFALPSDADHGRGAAAMPPVTADLFHQDSQSPGRTSDDASPRVAANDDRASIGQILQTLRRRPARLPYILASVTAFAWAAGGIATAYLYSAELQAMFATPRMGVAALTGTIFAIVVPVIFFYVTAHMFSRSQDMRLVAESMAQVAMRLAQPETTARESIVTVGQAIRREVAAMGDGVERALARAAELEALVHNEVSALERAYNDNEVRIRDLLSELSNQRETLVHQAEQVRNAIASVHLDLAHDITSVGDLVSDKVNEVAQRVTRTLTEKGEHITLALGHAGDSMIDVLTERGSTLLDRLETTSDKATNAIGSASERLSASLNFKTEHVHYEFAELAGRLQQMMTARLDSVAQGFAQKAALTIESMAGRSQQFTDAISDTSTRMAEQIAARGGDVVAKMEQTGARVSDTIASRSNNIADTFRD
ncbi:MAG: apolipoprotein A1/A4/E family protein, partial [Deltaproteobacteria bacterium]|nr:apolipoprotein A1/A4/E family protein [Deltaproteobacteria bacterium]